MKANMNLSNLKNLATSRTGKVSLVAAASAAATALWVQAQARRAEREHPPVGQFIDVDGVHLHYVERGKGSPVVLLHGNNVSHADFSASGLIDQLSKNHRVIAFDRPGYGHSNRPRDRLWTPQAQAALFHIALARLGVEQATVIGHSMGCMSALAMALDYPATVGRLVLLGGYFYPSVRVDALLAAPVALPVIGDVMRYTVTALTGRAALPGLVKVMFHPKPVPEEFFTTLSREMMLRPLQLRANSEDAAFMMPAAKALSQRYSKLKMPITIIAGAQDEVVNVQAHSTRLHQELPQSELHVVPDTGHMVHYVAQEKIVAAVDIEKPSQNLMVYTPHARESNGFSPQPTVEATRPF